MKQTCKKERNKGSFKNTRMQRESKENFLGAKAESKTQRKQLETPKNGNKMKEGRNKNKIK